MPFSYNNKHYLKESDRLGNPLWQREVDCPQEVVGVHDGVRDRIEHKPIAIAWGILWIGPHHVDECDDVVEPEEKNADYYWIGIAVEKIL